MAYPYDDPEQLALANYLMTQGRPGQIGMTGRQAATMAGSMAPGAGLADMLGLYPAGDQGFNPSLRQNLGKGEYMDALFQMLGAGGDLAMATGVGAPVGMTMKSIAATGKAGKAAKKAKPAKNIEEFLSMASRGKMHTAKNAAQELNDLKAGESKFAELYLDWDHPDTYDLDKQMKDLGFLSYYDRGSDLSYFYKDPKDIAPVVRAENPLERGLSYGYSQDDIANFYLKRRGGNVDAAYQEYLADVNKPGFDPKELRKRYPKTLAGAPAFDEKKGKQYISKMNSAEALAVEAARKAAQKDIDKGNYKPMFDVEKRYYADPTKYNIQGNTLTDAIPAKPETIAKYEAMYNTPEAKARLTEAFKKGSQDPMTKDWYAMGQLESEYIKRLGPDVGRQRFNEDFAQAMAATTGGADPTSNFLMGSFGNYQRARQKYIPSNAYDMPYPIGGRYASGNMKMYDKVLVKGNPLTAADQPKRFNFASDFLGDTSRATIDEQMMTGILPTLKAPVAGSYGVAEKVVTDLAKQLGVNPANAQDVMWAGLKDVPGKPMIQHVNESIERTARITGQTPEQVLDAMIRNRAPMYSAAPIGLMGLMGYDQYGSQGAD